MQDMPPVDLHIIDQIVIGMSVEDYKQFCQWRMIQFPDWLSQLITEEATLAEETFEAFVKTACINELVDRILKRRGKNVLKRIGISEGYEGQPEEEKSIAKL